MIDNRMIRSSFSIITVRQLGQSDTDNSGWLHGKLLILGQSSLQKPPSHGSLLSSFYQQHRCSLVEIAYVKVAYAAT